MPRTINLLALKERSQAAIRDVVDRHASQVEAGLHYSLLRWIAQMSAVEIHTVWERYAESRLIAALNHDATHFLRENSIVGVARVSSGLAAYVVRGGNRYFDFRSVDELVGRGNRLLGATNNPFRTIAPGDRAYLDALAAIRNCVVHQSHAAGVSYRKALRAVYAVAAAPEPNEFLNAVDRRAASPARHQPRLNGLGAVVIRAIHVT